MRDIIFKAKRLDNGEWIQGDLRHWRSGRVGIHDEVTHRTIEVDPETIGEYTSQWDKDGKWIFEGDRVLYRFSGVDSYGVVLFGTYGDQSGRCDQGFYIRWEDDADCLRSDLGFWTTEREIEIVGNIHDTEKEREGAKDGKTDSV